jgi:iron complex outermembrane recepter protein
MKNSYVKNSLIRIVILNVFIFFSANLSAEGVVLSQIIVTAQKRVQGLENVPISISAISNERIENFNFTTLGDLSSSVPNLQISKTGTSNLIGIRGISSGSNSGFEQSVAMYVDDVYYGRGQLIQQPLLDLERVEVLRGPQATLFGKNAIAGAISLTSAKPSDTLQASFSTLYESEHQESVTAGMLSGPITQQVAGRLAVSQREVDGWIDNNTLMRKEPNIEQTSARGTLLWDNNKNLKTTLKLEIAEFDTTGRSIENFAPVGSHSALFVGQNAVDTVLDYQREGSGSTSESEVNEVVLSVDYNVLDHLVTSTTALLQHTTNKLHDIDFTGLNLLDGARESEDFEQLSQEIRIISPIGETFDYIAGIYLQNNELTVTEDFFFGSGFTISPMLSPLAGGNWDRDFNQSSDLVSTFAQYSFHFNDELTLSVGGRYSYEKKEATRVLILNGGGSSGLPDQGLEPQAAFETTFAQLGVIAHNVNGNRDESLFDPSATLKYIFNEDTMMYASFTQGSKGGGYDVRSNNAANVISRPGSFEFRNESATSYETGAKITSNRGELNVSVFYTEYKDLQISQFDGQIGFNVQNAAEAVITGIELDGRFLLFDNLVLSGSIALLDFEYQDYDVAQCASPLVVVQPPSQTVPGLCNFNGLTGTNAPEITANLNIQYQHNIGQWAKLSYILNLDYSDEYFASPTLDPNTLQDAYAKVGARVALANKKATWQVALIGNNLTDERILTSANTLPFSNILTGGSGVAYYGVYDRPRNLAVELSYNF